MRTSILAIVLIVFFVFIFLRPQLKALISFIVSTNAFDLTPKVIGGRDVWDVGMVLFLITALHLFFYPPRKPSKKPTYVYLIYGYIAWMLLTLIYSIVAYNYDLVLTLKTSRHLILGYLVLFIFLRLYQTYDKSFEFLMKWLYIITYGLMLALVIQYVINKPIFYGLIISYQGSVRALPVFLPILMLFTWQIIFKYISNKLVRFHEFIYLLLSAFVIATTYTRGIYFATLLSLVFMFLIAAKQKRLNVKKAAIFILGGIFSISVLSLSGSINKVIDRAASGASIVAGAKSQQSSAGADTFTGRLALTGERIAMSAEHNPLFGYGFLHEDEVPSSLRNKLKYGSIIYSDYYKQLYQQGHYYVFALYSADIGWADLVLKTGIFGFGVFFIILLLILLSFLKENKSNEKGGDNLWWTAFYLEFFVLIILMFNGNPFVVNLQIPMFMLAGMIYCSNSVKAI